MKQGWLDKLERKIGWLRIPGLIRYVIAIQLVGTLIGLTYPEVYVRYFMLDFSAVARGEVWRLFTFIFCPVIDSINVFDIIFLAIELYLYYMIGNSLENIWGSFKFTLYYMSGYLLMVIAGLILYIGTGEPYWFSGLEYINESLFLAFAVLFPDMEFLLYFIIPIKAKWFALFYAAIMVVTIYGYISEGSFYGYINAIAIIVSMLNFLIFFLSTRNYARFSPHQVKRRRQFKKEAGPKVVPIYRHRCAICGRTEKDSEDLEFRFCSKCEGNYEYCSDHIYTHEHVRKSQ